MLLARPFVFIRHGETRLNREQRICGRSDVPLTALGEAQARQAAGWLDRPWSRVVTSTLQRAWRTAELAVPGQQAVRLDGLDERDWGRLDQLPLARQPSYEATPPGGESWADFQARVLAALNGVLASEEMPLVVAHSGVFRVIRVQLTGSPNGPRLANATPFLIRPGLLGWQIHRYMM
ncbi:histidine phosphatase family protein [Halomonas urumqiensis]|uniref:phosphoglycerate mutase (2,3-diphosphoglycerate-dependent) n=1 Tax=Halomonas urumqiensis TaxID=1684789 RepID=A0A2N7UF05_9GAMM|nr:histidine phosphatase family protein [Halomonas urumqiensis]PMR79017.1 histidine phosphatase family protein [Halomonas urumqiensis]PTB01011.1 histidine phosphatase family protein [Halomonas urumqiensis]GHE22956.1 phosphoglycerate mutase [Halomonas urumqiensis]